MVTEWLPKEIVGTKILILDLTTVYSCIIPHMRATIIV